ncbi:hypothetical protein AURDEDRAFT_169565, partial [Auricularia subglabra TFB-10046 SS5]
GLMRAGGTQGVHPACAGGALGAVDRAALFVRGILHDFFRPPSARAFGVAPLTPASSRAIASRRTTNALALTAHGL